jgi:hypothetical protein
MSDMELEGLMDDDLESKYHPLDKVMSLTCLDYEYVSLPKVSFTIYK